MYAGITFHTLHLFGGVSKIIKITFYVLVGKTQGSI